MTLSSVFLLLVQTRSSLTVISGTASALKGFRLPSCPLPAHSESCHHLCFLNLHFLPAVLLLRGLQGPLCPGQSPDASCLASELLAGALSVPMTCFPPSPLAREVCWVSSEDAACVTATTLPPRSTFSLSLSSSNFHARTRSPPSPGLS